MAGIDKSTARTIAVIALLFVVAWALRGYLPGIERVAERERSHENPVALAVDVALLSIAVGIIGFAIIARLRNRQVRRPGPGQLPEGRGTVGRPTWRFSLIALALVIGWVLLVMVLMRLNVQVPGEQAAGTPPAADPGSVPPATNHPPPQSDSPDDAGPNVVSYLIPPMLILMALIVVGTVIVSRRQRHVETSWAGEAPDNPARTGATESLARAAEVGLVEIGDLTREPRQAIIACYAAMERELTQVPGVAPMDCDTPSEVLARAVDRHALHAGSATRLVELFEEARFSPHVMNEGHRDAAVDALRLVLTELRSMA